MTAVPALHRFIGARTVRKEDARLLTGKGQFTDDVVLPGMLHVAFARSPIARGKIKSIDIEAAKATPGVHAVFTGKDLLPLDYQLVAFIMVEPPLGPKVHPLAVDRVAHVGDPIALVVADSRYIAEDAASLIVAEYEEEAPVLSMAEARTAPPIHPDLPNNIASPMELPTSPELARILETAPHVFSTKITQGRVVVNTMEPRAVIFSKNGENEITIYLSCQSPYTAHRMLAMDMRYPEAAIRVIAKDVGGGFGLKSQPWREELATIAAGMLLNRPVKWAEDRLEHMTTANLCREQQMELTLAFDNDAKLMGGHVDYAINNGAYPHFGADCNFGAAWWMWPAYIMPAFSLNTCGIYTNTIGLGGFRGPWGVETLTREVLLDIAARGMGVDPIEIRKRNLVKRSDQPRQDPTSQFPVEDISPYECLENLLTKVEVPAFRAEQAAARKEGRYLGLGLATYIEPTAVPGLPGLSGDEAQLRVDPGTGKVWATLGTHSQGHGTQTSMAQIIADVVGVSIDDVIIFEDDSSRPVVGSGGHGSGQAVKGGAVCIQAAQLLVEKIKLVAGHLSNANPEDVTIENGQVRVAGAPEMTRTLRDIAKVCYDTPDRMPPGAPLGLEAKHRYAPPPVTWTSAAHAAIVEIDAETGFVKILRWVCSEDCGVMINPAIVEGQIAGGLAQAIGQVLLEEMHFDELGNPTDVTMKDYLMPTAFDVPDFEYTHIVTPTKQPGGFRGVGEGGAIIGPAVLMNAINDALVPFGTLALDLPVTPSKLLKLMEGGVKAAA